MLKDMVIDTNVFLHACNPGVTYYQEAGNLMTALLRVSTILRVDEGFDKDEARNQSIIMSEYLTHFHIGMLAYAIVSHLASTDRIRPVPRSVKLADGRRVNRIIPEPRDRVFLKVAMNSEDLFLTSHDFAHFPLPTRIRINKIFQVQVKTSGETLAFL